MIFPLLTSLVLAYAPFPPMTTCRQPLLDRTTRLTTFTFNGGQLAVRVAESDRTDVLFFRMYPASVSMDQGDTLLFGSNGMLRLESAGTGVARARVTWPEGSTPSPLLQSVYALCSH